jgi:hypothetical protein
MPQLPKLVRSAALAAEWRGTATAAEPGDSRRKEFILLEVKSARDNLGTGQQGWIGDNHELLHLPFRLVKIMPQSFIQSKSAAAT